MTLQACDGASAKPLDGQVVEAYTLKPIAAAWIVAEWYGEGGSAFGHSHTYFVHNEQARSGLDGHFQTPAWHENKTGPSNSVILYAYTPGYEQNFNYDRWAGSEPDFEAFQKRGGRMVYMEPSKRDRRDRLRFLLRMVPVQRAEGPDELIPYGGITGGSGADSLPLYRAVCAEMKSLATTDEELAWIKAYAVFAARHVLDRWQDTSLEQEQETQLYAEKILH